MTAPRNVESGEADRLGDSDNIDALADTFCGADHKRDSRP
jgi:hypothetical protein